MKKKTRETIVVALLITTRQDRKRKCSEDRSQTPYLDFTVCHGSNKRIGGPGSMIPTSIYILNNTIKSLFINKLDHNYLFIDRISHLNEIPPKSKQKYIII